ncbi:hypothetical protein [Paracoccus sp. M683]|nr:hypothetical protein [Paracoccus sp. M683]
MARHGNTDQLPRNQQQLDGDAALDALINRLLKNSGLDAHRGT